MIVACVLASGIASTSTYVSNTFFDRDTFVDTFDDVGTEESLVERVIESFNADLAALAESEEDESDADGPSDSEIEAQLRAEALALELDVTDDDDEPLSIEELREVLDDEQQRVIRTAVDRVVNRTSFPEEFTGALDDAHGQLLEAAALEIDPDEEATTSDGEVFLSLEQTYDEVVDDLRDEPAAARVVAAADSALIETGTLKIADRTTTFDYLWEFFGRAENLAGTGVFVAVVLLVLAVAIAERRPWTLIATGIGIIGLAAVVTVTMYVILGVIPLFTDGRVSADLVSSVYARALSPLLRIQIVVAAIGVALAVLGVVARLVWPDDWVYSHYDDGTGPRAVERRATRAERKQRRSAVPGSRSGRGGRGGGNDQVQQPQQEQWADQQGWVPQAGGQTQGGGPLIGGGPSQGGNNGGGWDYDSAQW